MPRVRARIFHKGLIILLVPLLFELAVAAAMLHLQLYYYDSVQAEVVRKQVIFHTNELWYECTAGTTDRTGAAFLESVNPSRSHSFNAYKQYHILKRLIADDSAQSERLDNIMEYTRRVDALCKQLKPLPASEGPRSYLHALGTNLRVVRDVMEEAFAFHDQIRRFREYELARSAQATEKVHRIAHVIQMVLAVAVVGSVIIAFILFRYFMQGIYSGVRRLMDNIERFKSGRALSPVLQTGDEIALLDARFHEMADEVGAAQAARQRFVSAISRQFRAPMDSVREYLHGLKSGQYGGVPDKVCSRAERAERSLERLLVLLDDLLRLDTRVTAGLDINPRPVNVRDLVRASIDAVSAYADKFGVSVQSSDCDFIVCADPDRIVQVLVNLLSNAVKFSPAGASVDVSACSRDKEIEIRVSDRGRGIPAALQQTIFERFAQVEAADASEKGGTGLGLPICKQIVELHGGTIGVESQEGMGSTFSIRLPALGGNKE
ncbi:MAG TPA: HAMP domain-containing sensor histidine kinase [Candidatus Obscuribacterales bacterium]